ncbi:MAG: glutamine-hydrolyzing carbamoyl-phosphate synthase small subunit [Candidatus Omnitrophica bacterium]|nr:glutamine-hydrolyzing carbamoyl-phosphate synthase small subunit [Candidatus Omnitrophota bacterium]
MKAILVLEDGSSFEGKSLGVEGEKIGEVVLNTAVVGYQELMTDPVNAGKILVLTYPLIGNYGVAKKFNESDKCWISGLAIKEPSRIYSNWQAEGSFDEFVKKEGVVAISDIDTRTLAVTIRDKGEMFGIISTKSAKKEELLAKIKEYKKSAKADFVKKISVKKPFEIKGKGAKIAIIDLGTTNSLIKQLTTLGCDITLLPYDTDPALILSKGYNGVIISNGPENDEALRLVAQNVRSLLGNVPLLGISTGHEVIAMALGGKLERMRLGHRGVNYPVKPDNSFKGHITVQNHAYVVKADSLTSRKELKITLRNVNDKSVEEMEGRGLKLISTQYYPASPGFDEVNNVFLRFLNMIPAAKAKTAKLPKNSKKDREVAYAKA